MWKLLKHSKPYTGLILLAIVLLFAQANLELALPDYLSDIVDTGIQQHGVENAVPIAIRGTEMERVLLFVNESDRAVVLSHYELVDENSSNYYSTLNDYPVLENGSIYLLKSSTSSVMNDLDQLMKLPQVIVFSFEQRLAANSSSVYQSMNITMPAGPVDPTSYFFSVLGFYPPSAIQAIKKSINDTLTAQGGVLLDQVSILAVRKEYEKVGVDIDSIQMNYLLKSGALMLLMTLLAAVATVSVSFLAARTAAGMARDIRSSVFKKISGFSNSEFDQFSTASLITRSTNDVVQIQNVTYMFIRLVFYAPLIGVGGIIHALAKSRSMWWLIALAVSVLLALIIVIFIIAVPKFQLMQKLTDRINLVSRENLSGMLVIRAFNMQEHEEQKFDRANVELTSVSLFIARLMVVLMPFMMLIMNGLTIGILWVGSHQVADTQIQVGDMMAFMQYSIQIVFAFLMLSMMFIIIPRAAVSGKRINDVLETEATIEDPAEQKVFSEPFRGEIEFRDVTFVYPGATSSAIENISFTARPGKTTAFIGSTGSGKSTIINLIPRFYDVTQGKILIDGIDIREVNQKTLRDKISYVPQKNALFSGTIESNMQFGDENASEEEIMEALRIAQAENFVSEKKDGIKAEIAQSGTNVSGGQKQRLTIARALVKKAPIYIFDDSVSALDFKTDAALRKALNAKIADKTVLIVAQRVSTIKNADQIIVLDEGVIVGMGTHEELLESCPIYEEIASTQLELEEGSI